MPRFRAQANRLALYVCAAVAATAVYSPFVIGVGWVAEALPSNSVHRAKAGALALIPPRVAVSASDQLGGHLSERLRIMIFPVVREARWIVVDKNDPTYQDDRGYESRINGLRHTVGWRLAYSSHGVLVFRRQPNAR